MDERSCTMRRDDERGYTLQKVAPSGVRGSVSCRCNRGLFKNTCILFSSCVSTSKLNLIGPCEASCKILKHQFGSPNRRTHHAAMTKRNKRIDGEEFSPALVVLFRHQSRKRLDI